MHETEDALAEQYAAALWGKSGTSQSEAGWGLLLQHLLDTASVAEVLWDDVLADAVREPLDECTDGRGRQSFALLGGWHDLGKATPGFQAKVPDLARAVDATGLRTRPETSTQRWRHERASAAIAREVLDELWPPDHVQWFWGRSDDPLGPAAVPGRRPAHAGVLLRSAPLAFACTRRPRPRGGAPSPPLPRSGHSRSSPPTRGCSGRSPGAAPPGQVVPAHAEVLPGRRPT